MRLGHAEIIGAVELLAERELVVRIGAEQARSLGRSRRSTRVSGKLATTSKLPAPPSTQYRSTPVVIRPRTYFRTAPAIPASFFLLTSANEIITTFNQIGTALSNLRLAM
jgi:hypothetical protein